MRVGACVCSLSRERMASALRLQRSTTGASARPRTSRPTQIDGIRAPRRIPGSITHSAHASGTARSIGQLLPTWKCQLNTANLRRYATAWPIKPELRVIKVFLTKWRRLGESSQMRLREMANPNLVGFVFFHLFCWFAASRSQTCAMCISAALILSSLAALAISRHASAKR